MNELAVVDKDADWRPLKTAVLDSVSSPITLVWPGAEAWIHEASVAAWRVALEARGLGAVSTNVLHHGGAEAGCGSRRQRAPWEWADRAASQGCF